MTSLLIWKKKVLEKNGGYDSYKKLSKKANISHQNMFYYFVWARAHLRRHNSFLLKNSWPHFPSCKKKDGRHAWNSAPPETKEPYLVVGSTVHTTGCWNKTKKNLPVVFWVGGSFKGIATVITGHQWKRLISNWNSLYIYSLKYFSYKIITSFRRK
jgi:hypothetical protein